MLKKSLKTWIISIFIMIMSICSVCGIGFLSVRAEGNISMSVTSIGGGSQEDLSRYLIRVYTDVEFEYEGTAMPEITITVNGEEKTVETFNAIEDTPRHFALVVPFEVAPFEQSNEIVIKAGTVIQGYEIAKDATIVVNGYNMSLVVNAADGKPISLQVACRDDGSIRYGVQDNLSRYLFYLQTDRNDLADTMWEPNFVTLDAGTENEKQITINYVGAVSSNPTDPDYNPSQILAVLSYSEIVGGATLASEVGQHTITIKAGTVLGGGYVVTEDLTICLNGDSVSLENSSTPDTPTPDVPTPPVENKPISLSVVTLEDGNLRAFAQETGSRYLFYLQTDRNDLADTMWEPNFVTLDAGTENEKEIAINYVGAVASNPADPDYNTSQILAVLPYDEIVKGATSASEVGKHSITIKEGTVLAGGYVVKEDLVIYLGNEYIALDESELPQLPIGVFKATTGLANKTIDYTTTKIEDYIASAPVVKLKANAVRDENNNVFLESHDASIGYCKSLKIGVNEAEPQIKFRSVYEGGDIYLVMELRSQLDGGNFWLTDGAPVVRLRYVEEFANLEAGEQCMFFDFFANGLQDSPQYSIFHNTEFTLDKGQEFFVEFGAVNKKDAQGNDGFVFFVCVTQGDKVAYGECMMTGDYNVSQRGAVTIYESPANSAILMEGAWNQGDNDVASFTIMSVDSEREIDGVMTAIGAMSLYNPAITYAEKYDKYDISDLVPLGDGMTYTKIEGDVTSQSQSMINATSVPVKNGGYSITMKLKFTGEDFGCTFAFRGKNTLAQSGYKLVIAENIVLCGVMSANSPFQPNVEYDVEIGCIDYYIAEEKTASGTYVYLKVNGEMIVSDQIDKITGTGTYFCGLVEGSGGSSVTVSSAKAANEQAAVEIVATSNKTTVLTGKKATLGYTSNMKTAYDKVTYEVVRGNARINGDGVYSESDYEIAIRVKIENEYGTFYSEEIVINEGMVEKKGCHSSLCMSGSILAGMVGMSMLVMKRNKKENE